MNEPKPAATPTGDPTQIVMQLLTGGRARKWKDVVGWTVAGVTLGLKARAKYREWRAASAYSVTIDDGDDIFIDVQDWLLQRIPAEERRGLAVATRRGGNPRNGMDTVAPAGDGGPIARNVWLSYDGTKVQRVIIDGHPIDVSMTKRQYTKESWGDPGTITFTAIDLAGREAAVAFLQEVCDGYEKRRRGASLYIATRWGEWSRAGELPARSLSSVVLAGDQVETLVEDLARFMRDEQVYNDLGIPWHRGYLFYGPPGTGKTSIAKALAGHLGLDLYYLALKDLAADTDLARLVSNLSPRSVLLLEDIDISHAAKQRDDTAEGPSLQGLLQVTDGVLTPHGLVTIMSANRGVPAGRRGRDVDVDAGPEEDELDEALVRTGRVDVAMEIDYLVDEQLVRLVASIAPGATQPQYPSVVDHKVSPADVIEMAKPHLRDPAAVVDAVFTGLLELVGATS